MKSRNLLILVLLLMIAAVSIVSYKFMYNNPNLSDEESNFIKNHPVLYIAPDPDFGPVEFIDENGEYKGIASDYIKWISNQYDLNIQVVNLETWDNILDNIKLKKVDMLGAAAFTEQRSEYLIFSEPFINLEGIILTKSDSSENLTEKDLIGKRVLSIRGYSLTDYMETNFPEVEINKVTNVQEGLQELSFGEADALLLDIGQASFYIEKYNYTNLKISGKLNFSYNLRFAFRNDYSDMRSIFDKALATMPTSKKQEIHNKWIYEGDQSSFDYMRAALIFMIPFIILIFILIFILQWNNILKSKVEEKTSQLREELEAKHIIEDELIRKNDEITKINAVITTNQKELEELNSKLEAKVERRTKLLNMTNRELEHSMYTLQMKQGELENSNKMLSETITDLKDTQHKLIESEKQASLGRLVTGISHEINTPLGNSITGISFIISEIKNFNGNELSDEFNELLDDIYASSRMIHKNLNIAANLINRFKQISVEPSENREKEIIVNDLINSTLADLSSKVTDKKIAYKLECRELIKIKTYPNLFQQIIASLFENSVVHGYEDISEGIITVNLSRNENFLFLVFSDDGKGIPSEYHHKIFDPFFTTKIGKGSVGLGLHLVYTIVTQIFKGEVQLNKTDQGAEFSIILPLDMNN